MTILAVNLQPRLEATTVGAKAANLGKVMANGISVPPGFVVTRNALNLFLEQTGLQPQVEAFVSHCLRLEKVDRAAAFTALCRQIEAAPIPEPLTAAIAEMADPLLAKALAGVAVRSSGIHEDSATASFAGIYASYLGIRSVEGLWVAVKQCWCSAWAPQAIAYAKRMGITPAVDSMAVLIQQLVVADSAGVLFTANPRTGNPWQFILESTFGLAQDLVGSVGDVPADRFVCEWHTGEILERQIVQKPTACVPGEAGVQVVPVPEARRLAPSLSDPLATQIATVGLMLDRLFGCRVDIEWAVADDEIYIVQVRPITALPAFFPHHLPSNLADRHWEPTWPYWYFDFQDGGKIVPPLHRDLSYVEMFVRYQLGPIDLHQYRFAGVEADFNGHRYRAADPRWPHMKVSAEQFEAYLQAYEPALRQMWLDAKRHRFPALLSKVVDYLHHAHSIKEQIQALLWARDVGFDLTCLTIGPPQCLFGVCIDLLRGFLAEHLPGLNADPLWHGYHPDLEPYYPHAQVQAAETLVATIEDGEIRQAFATMTVQSLFQYLIEHAASSPFVRAYDAYCERFGLVPLKRFDEIFPGEKAIHYSVIQIIQDAFFGKSAGVAANYEQVMQRRRICEAECRLALTKKEPDLLPRFEQLLDWVSFWGPALNDRAWATVPGNQIGGLWTLMCRKLQTAGLVATPTDVRYFTVEDLVYIAQTGNIEEGRRIWQRRRLAYEHNDRLQAPLYLGKALGNAASPNATTNGSTEKVAMLSPAQDSTRVTIRGRGHSPGQTQGIAHKIATLDESTTVTEQHILILTKTVQPTSQYSALLLALILRVQGIIVVQAGPTYTHHIAQIARECGVPVLEIAPGDLDHIPDRAELMVDGSAGTVMLVA